MKLPNFDNWSNGELSKLGIILRNKVLSKNANNKKCAPKFVFFNEKKSERLE